MQVKVLDAERRRRWGYEDKVRIVEETMEPGAIVCNVARRHGVSQSLVFAWRRQAREGRLGGADAAPVLLPVEIVSAAASPPATEPQSSRPARRGKAGVIEIELGAGRRVRVDRDVDAEALGRVLDVLSRSRRTETA